MKGLCQDEVFLSLSLNGAQYDPNPLGRLVYQYPQLRAARARREELVEELMSRFGAMRVCRRAVVEWMEVREERVAKSLGNRNNIRKIPGMAARLEDRF